MIEVHVEWGPPAVEVFEGWADVVVVVDVLSFSTAVDVVVSRGAAAVPSAIDREAIARLGEQHGAHVAVPRSKTSATRPYSLSPASLGSLPANSTVVLASPNGATLTARLAAGGASPSQPASGQRASGRPASGQPASGGSVSRDGPSGGQASSVQSSGGQIVVAGCLRNAAAVGVYVASVGSRVGVLAAGERWPQDGSLRPAFEDLIGAGAVIASVASAANARLSSEASASTAAFADAKDDLELHLSECVSGGELSDRGYEIDVTWAAALNVSQAVPVLVDGKYVSALPTE